MRLILANAKLHKDFDRESVSYTWTLLAVKVSVEISQRSVSKSKDVPGLGAGGEQTGPGPPPMDRSAWQPASAGGCRPALALGGLKSASWFWFWFWCWWFLFQVIFSWSWWISSWFFWSWGSETDFSLSWRSTGDVFFPGSCPDQNWTEMLQLCCVRFRGVQVTWNREEWIGWLSGLISQSDAVYLRESSNLRESDPDHSSRDLDQDRWVTAGSFRYTIISEEN